MSHFALDRSDFQMSGDIPDYQNLPDLVILKIFEYLNPRELRRVGSLCKKFYSLSKESSTWKHLDVEHLHLDSRNFISLLSQVPDYFTRLRIGMNFQQINILDLFLVIYVRFPYLEELYIEFKQVQVMSYSFKIRPDIVDLMLNSLRTDINYKKIMLDLRNNFGFGSFPIFVPQSLRLLSLRVLCDDENIFPHLMSPHELPNLHILEFTDPVSDTYTTGEIRLLSSLTQLRELYLNSCINQEGIEYNIQYFHSLNVLKFDYINCSTLAKNLDVLVGHVANLTELHFCDVYDLEDTDLKFVDGHTFPNLEVFCVYQSPVTEKGVERLFGVCHSLKTVYANVGEENIDRKYGVYRRILENICFFPQKEEVRKSILKHSQRYHLHSNKGRITSS